jgi:hypothetical protein
MADMDLEQAEARPRNPEDVAKNVSELNYWRRIKVDPLLDRHQAVLIDGENGEPSVLLSQGLLHGKFDTLISIGHGIVVLITVFGILMGILQVCGPWIRQKFVPEPTRQSDPTDSRIPPLSGAGH